MVWEDGLRCVRTIELRAWDVSDFLVLLGDPVPRVAGSGVRYMACVEQCTATEQDNLWLSKITVKRI